MFERTLRDERHTCANHRRGDAGIIERGRADSASPDGAGEPLGIAL